MRKMHVEYYPPPGYRKFSERWDILCPPFRVASYHTEEEARAMLAAIEERLEGKKFDEWDTHIYAAKARDEIMREIYRVKVRLAGVAK